MELDKERERGSECASRFSILREKPIVHPAKKASRANQKNLAILAPVLPKNCIRWGLLQVEGGTGVGMYGVVHG
jgi:hypothetical protein